MITDFSLNVFMFCISTVFDFVLFSLVFFLLWKIFKTKIITFENNWEIHQHDKTLLEIKEKINQCKKG